MEIKIKKFSELTTSELYNLLQLRSEVFVVEQKCIYQDIDNKDLNALHVMGFKNNILVAYTRVFNKGDYFKLCSIGRVVVSKKYRDLNLGKQIMLASIKVVEDYFESYEIKISAQCHLDEFYRSINFQPKGESYLEDGIPHISMYYIKGKY